MYSLRALRHTSLAASLVLLTFLSTPNLTEPAGQLPTHSFY